MPSSHDELVDAVDVILEYIESIAEGEQLKVEELGYEYLMAVARRGDAATATNLAQRFVCSFCLWVGAKPALQAMKQDDWMYHRATEVAGTYLQIPPHPPPPRRKAA